MCYEGVFFTVGVLLHIFRPATPYQYFTVSEMTFTYFWGEWYAACAAVMVHILAMLCMYVYGHIMYMYVALIMIVWNSSGQDEVKEESTRSKEEVNRGVNRPFPKTWKSVQYAYCIHDIMLGVSWSLGCLAGETLHWNAQEYTMLLTACCCRQLGNALHIGR